ncbi:MAG: metal-dependent hydrolase [Deltaproteobacteria bacterium]|nr:metal-dependent hydrolase [Deltaproteobacteria bacterium]MBW2121661.1 metal-dependent hydrolase [Deltaproteobacteria bacterium]
MTGSEVRLQYLSNSGFLLTTEEGKRVLIDPWLTGNPSAPFGPEGIPRVGSILVTHAAFDHLGDSLRIASRDKAFLVCDYLVRELARAEGLPKEQVKTCSYGGRVETEGVSLRVLQAKHVSYAMDDAGRPSTGIPLAFLITTPGGLRIYHAGDTCLFGDMKLIGLLYRPQIGLIPVGAASPLYGKDLPPREAAQAVQWIGCELAVPIHYCDPEDPPQFAAAAKILAPWTEVRPMEPGEELVLSVIRQGARTTFILKET